MIKRTVIIRVTESIKNNDYYLILCMLIGMKAKNHDRSPEKKGFSVALPKTLIAEVEAIAKSEHRSRNGQIERFLEQSVKLYRESQKPNGNHEPLRSAPRPLNQKRA